MDSHTSVSLVTTGSTRAPAMRTSGTRAVTDPTRDRAGIELICRYALALTREEDTVGELVTEPGIDDSGLPFIGPGTVYLPGRAPLAA